MAIIVAVKYLPQASFDVLAPVGHDPVREVDILSRAQAHGNLATPFGWGCYCSWRLNPLIKISMDGRYETTYPESTFELNDDFYEKRGTNWDQLIRDYPVDYVILEFRRSICDRKIVGPRLRFDLDKPGAIPRCWPCKNSPASSRLLPPDFRPPPSIRLTRKFLTDGGPVDRSTDWLGTVLRQKMQPAMR